jgi:protein-S-isoprenylcysteine O-methyltransferase Ste14
LPLFLDTAAERLVQLRTRFEEEALKADFGGRYADYGTQMRRCL